MKILLTVVVNAKTEQQPASSQNEGVELIYPVDNENERDFVLRAAKAAKGKYCVLQEKKFMFADVQSLLNILDKNTSDLVTFSGGMAVKASILRSVAKDCKDFFSAFLLSVLESKTILKTTYIPFSSAKTEVKFNSDNETGIMLAAEAFSKAKANLSKGIYSYALNSLCAHLVNYYLYAMVEIRSGFREARQLIEFDNKLKAEIVLYLALEKNFTAAKLSKLRKKEFKISGFTAKKFAKLINMK